MQSIKIIKTLYLLAWMLLIFQLSSIPGDAFAVPTNDAPSFAAHFLLYCALAILSASVFLSWRKNKNFDRQMALAVFLFCALYGASDEFHQGFVVGRDASLADLAFDAFGALAGIWIYQIWPRLWSALIHGKPRLLLHICCAGCGVYISKLMKKEYETALFYCNPNIFPQDEYDSRLKEAKKVAKKFGLPLVVGKYNHDDWLRNIKGHETDPEKGGRCKICYRVRLEETARMAKEKKFACFTTTLSASPHKDAQAINAIGKELSERYGVEFLEKDFKKRDGFKKSSEMSKELGLYRQNYCGCEFSKR